MKCFILIIYMIMLSGCIYPVNKILQPKAKITVLDLEGQPVSAAKVYLIAKSYPYAREKSRNMVTSNDAGEAVFTQLDDWRIEVLMLHGSEEFFWNWCVKKKGYETGYTNYYNADDFIREDKIFLKKGESKLCPENIGR